jgi:catechol-2,3-dioxygenase
MTATNTGIGIKRLQHAVLVVSDVERSVRFYNEVLGLEFHRQRPNGMAFLTIPGSGNDHDLALVPQPDAVPARTDTARLFHLAWEVGDVRDLVRARERMQAAGAFVGATNHGMSLSLYGKDPDGLEFEVFWAIPGATFGENVPLDLEAELARYAPGT